MELTVSHAHYPHLAAPTYWAASVSALPEVTGVGAVTALPTVFTQVLSGFGFLWHFRGLFWGGIKCCQHFSGFSKIFSWVGRMRNEQYLHFAV